MTFETWAKDLLCKSLKSQGTMLYVRKPRRQQGWYCATPNGFLLHVEAEKVSFGYFRINYEIMPLIGRIFDAGNGISSVTMGSSDDVSMEYIMKSGSFSHDHKSLNLKSKDIGESETDKTVVDMVCDYLNPLFHSLTSYEDYCKSAIEIMLFHHNNIAANRRKELAQMLFEHRQAPEIKTPEYVREKYPADFPWYTQRITQMPYVYAFLGKYEEALAEIRGIRQVRMEALEHTYALGYYDKDTYLKQKQIIENENQEIESAMQKGDRALVNEILSANYRRNQILIYERIGLEIPDEYSIL